jgi:hypothetical protein
VTDQRRLNLPLFALGAVAAHAVVLAALLPMLVTLPGSGSNRRGPVVIDVDVTPLPARGASAETGGTTGSVTLDHAANAPSAPAPAPTDTTSATTTGTVDPLTTQSVTPAIQDQAKKSTGQTAEAGGSSPGEAEHEANTSDSAVARAEPSEPLPPQTILEQAPAKEPTAEKPQSAEKSEAKKPAAKTQETTHAKPATPRTHRLVKAKPKTPAKGGDFQTLFSGSTLAPTLPQEKRATR